MEFKNYDKAEEKYEMAAGGWMKLLEGDNKIRIVMEFEDFGSHWSPKHERSFTCIGKEKCPFCKAGEKPTVKYIGWVIDRADKQVKLLTIGHSIFKLIGKLANSEEYAFTGTPNYDITINRTGQKLDTRYTVIASRKDSELTKKELADVEKNAERTPAEIVEEMKAKMIGAVEDAEGEDEVNMETLTSSY